MSALTSSEFRHESIHLFLVRTFSVKILYTFYTFSILFLYTFYGRGFFLLYFVFCVCLLNNAISPEFHEKSGAREKAGLNLLYCSYGVFCIKTVVGLLGHMLCSFVTSRSMLTLLTIPIYIFHPPTHKQKGVGAPLLLAGHMFNSDLSTSLYNSPVSEIPARSLSVLFSPLT